MQDLQRFSGWRVLLRLEERVKKPFRDALERLLYSADDIPALRLSSTNQSAVRGYNAA
jgi:hypothetical protein